MHIRATDIKFGKVAGKFLSHTFGKCCHEGTFAVLNTHLNLFYEVINLIL